MNIMTSEKHSASMTANKSKDTKIEVILRKALWHKGIRYKKNYKICGCKPDIVITKYKIAIFCDGDFWHGHEGYANFNFRKNIDYWNKKINRNIERDLENTIELRDNGWTVLRFWESEIKNDLEYCLSSILQHIALLSD